MLGVGRLDMIKVVAAVFGEHGDIIDIVLIKDKRAGIQHEYCFVKYATLEQAQRAIGAFNIPYTFPKVRYAERERERERFGDYLLDENYILVSRLL
ncbi:hypothetical protein CASFOL_028076 [Castilleja foliolosa]|uniref:RRM domain-containing protein n=1 Tax=Castilleja foliolosa TaxID=1961234 RepID=A0ABD3CEK1_9LAMI